VAGGPFVGPLEGDLGDWGACIGSAGKCSQFFCASFPGLHHVELQNALNQKKKEFETNGYPVGEFKVGKNGTITARGLSRSNRKGREK
jgi:hypothetical protein